MSGASAVVAMSDEGLADSESAQDVKQDQRMSMQQAALSPRADDDSDASEDEGLTSVGAGMGATDQVPLTPEGAEAVLKQIEFYFSDASLPSDKKLLKQIRKDPEGYVPIKVFANFRKVRALTRDVDAISTALQASTLLMLKDDGKQVRRIIPVPEYNIEEIQRRTVVVENLPVGSTIESVTKMMRTYGTVKLVRICSKETKGKLPAWLTTALGSAGLHSVNSTGGRSTPTVAENKPPHAFVEFADEEEAVMAVAALHDTEGWRPLGIQVHHLIYASSSTPKVSKQEQRLSSRSSTLGGTVSGSIPRRNSHRDESPNVSNGRNAGLAPSMSERPPSSVGGWRSTGTSLAGATGPLARRCTVAVDTGSAPCSNPTTPSRGATVNRFLTGSAGGSAAAADVSEPSRRYVPPGRRSVEAGAFSGQASPAMPASPMYMSAHAAAYAAQRSATTGGSPNRPPEQPRSAPGAAPDLSPYNTIGPVVANDLVINPSQLALRPIRTGAAPARADSGSSSNDPSTADGTVLVASLLSPSAVEHQQSAFHVQPTGMASSGGGAGGGRTSPASRLGVPALQSGRTTPTSNTAGITTRPSLEKRSSGAPKFVLDLPPGSAPGNRAPGSAGGGGSNAGAGPAGRAGLPPKGSSSAGASPLAMPYGAGARVFQAAVADATTNVTFQPLSPSCMPPGSTAHLPFHHSGQYIAEVEDFINKIIPPGIGSSSTPAGPGTPVAGADSALVQNLSRVSEGAEREPSVGSRGSGGGGLRHAPSVLVGGARTSLSGVPHRVRDVDGSSGGGGEADEEVARFRAALEEARGVNPASAQAQAHVSRALAAAAAGGRPAPRPPRPGASSPITSHASTGPDTSSGTGAGTNGGRGLIRHSSWHATSNGGSTPAQAITDPGMQVAEAHVRSALGLPVNMPIAHMSAAGHTSAAPAAPQSSQRIPIAPAAGRDAVAAVGAEEEDGSDGGEETAPVDGVHRRRRRRGSRAGSRSRRNSTASAAGAASSEIVSAVTTPSHAPQGGELQLASAGGGANQEAAAAATAHLRSQAARLVASAGGARAGSPQQQRTNLKQQQRDSATAGNTPTAAAAAAQQGRRPSKVDYASWAAATPEYRAEACAKYGGNMASPENNSGYLAAGVASSPQKRLSTTVSETANGNQPHVVVAAGPDGTKGFHAAGRGRGAPLPQASP